MEQYVSNSGGRPRVDDVDRRILAALAEDARIPNNALAEIAGIAPSTCLGRVRALRERGVIRGFHTEIDLDALGYTLQAIVSVRLQPEAHGRVEEFIESVAALPGVLNIYLVAGSDDVVVHVTAKGAQALRGEVLDTLNADPGVATAQTTLVFEHRRVRLDTDG